MYENDYTESLFRSIDTIVAERIKSLPYDATQLAEIIDDSSANAGMYKVTSNHQLEEIAYADNPTYEKGDKVYILNTADDKRRFILGLYQRSDTGRTDRIMSILNGSIISLKDLLQKELHDGLDGLDGKIEGLNIYFGLTADGLLSLIEDKEAGLKTAISQTASEIRMEAEDMYNGLESSFSITAGQIRSEVYDFAAGLESSITQTAGEIRSEVHDYYNELESSISQTAGEIRSEVHNYANGLESSITQTAGEIRTEVNDKYNQLSSMISQTAGEIRSEVIDQRYNLRSEFRQTADEIRTTVEDLNQGLSTISQTAAEINSQVIDLEGNISEISQTAEEISSQVTDLYGNYSLLEQTADQISSRVETVEGNYSEIVQTADQISSRVEGIEGGYSEIRQTADGIISRVENIEGDYSTREQTANMIRDSVSGLVDGAYVSSQIKQFANQISLSVTNDTTNQKSSIQITGPGINIDSKDITLGGNVIFKNNLTDGTTTISGNNITTGTINAKDVGVKWIGTDKGGGFTVANGSTGDVTTFGAMMYGWQTDIDSVITALQADSTPDNATFPNNYIIATSGGVRMTHGDYDFYIADNGAHIVEATLYTPDGTVSSSDKNLKNSINYDFQKYENFYNLLQPAYYKFNSGTSNRFHIGFIYQDVETALLRSGITSQDFAGLVKNHGEKGEVKCGLRYEEFIALNTHMIQKTRKELEEKDNKIQQLENKIDELEQKLNLLLETLS